MESFKQPWLILVTVLLSFIGIFWALLIGRQSLDVFVMMVGIVVNNAILIMDQFNVAYPRGGAASQGDD